MARWGDMSMFSIAGNGRCFLRLRRSVLALLLVGLSACSTTGETFRSAGLDRIVVGRTTLAQAAVDLGAQPVDTWQQGDTLLARWAYKGTVATDAVYFREEVWLRFGPDGRFMRTERAINVPPQHHTRTAQEADREAAEARARTAPPAATPVDPTGPVLDGGAQSLAIPVPPPPSVEPVASSPGSGDGASIPGAAPAAEPLLPAGTRIIPGATYPVGSGGR
jgi:hypothetical protein